MRRAQLYFQLHLYHTTEKDKEDWSKLYPDGETEVCLQKENRNSR